MNIAMIPARMGSQRLKQKNLRELGGVSLVARAIRKCIDGNCFDSIWVNSESEELGAIAEQEGVQFHKRPAELANDVATSEDFVAEFLEAHACARVFQVHTIAPLITGPRVVSFVDAMVEQDVDVLLSCTLEHIECAIDDRPINFSFDAKTNSQELTPIQRISWGITGWKRETFLSASRAGATATYAGRIGFFPLSRVEGHIIKTEEDLRIAEALLNL